MNINVKKLHDDAVIPTYAHSTDAGFDFYAVEDVLIAPGGTQMIGTGLAIDLPYGYEIQVRPRSGLSAKTKLRVANAPGTIDSGFRGEIKIIMDNINYPVTGDNPVGATLVNEVDCDTSVHCPKGTYLIKAGDRIAQGVLQPVTTAYFWGFEKLSESDRGTGGFGSTGK